MPIRLKCTCGKVLSVRDELAGKAVKCPGCQTVLRIPATASGSPNTGAPAGSAKAGSPAAAARPAGAAAPQRAAPRRNPATKTPATAPAGPAPTMADGDLDDLFSEAGFQLRTGKTCPNCFAAMTHDAVLCTACGFHQGTGDKLKAHASEFEDEASGEAVLKRAELDMQRSKQMQEKLASGAGLPWWMLGLILFMLASTTAVAVIAVNLSRREEGSGDFNAVATLLMLAAIATAVLAIGALTLVLYRACMESVKQGLLVLFLPPYALYYGFTRFGTAGKPLLLALIAGGAAGGLFTAYTMYR